MSPKELQQILDRLNVSRGKFGLILGATRRSGENWTDPDRGPVPGPVATIAQLLDTLPALLPIVEGINRCGSARKKKGRT
jgi:DNA-binding transcriptional regulator YiaG